MREKRLVRPGVLVGFLSAFMFFACCAGLSRAQNGPGQYGGGYPGAKYGGQSDMLQDLLFNGGNILPTYMVTVKGINFNSANTDTTFTLLPPPGGFTRFNVRAAYIGGASAAINTATVSMWTSTGGGGVNLVAAATAVTVTTAAEDTNNNMQILGGTNASTESHSYFALTSGQIYFRVQTPQGSAATANVTVVVQYLP